MEAQLESVAGEIGRKRGVLLSLRTQYSPEVQSVREAALERLVEQTLFLAGGAITLPELEDQIGAGLGGRMGALRRPHLKKALRGLANKSRVTGSGRGLAGHRYGLTHEATSELTRLNKEAEDRINRVVGKLFRDSPGGPDRYVDAFFEAVRLVFSQVAESYVELLKGEIDEDQFVTTASLRKTLRAVQERHSSVSGSELEAGVAEFLRGVDPEQSAIKWNLTQNYYITKTLGLDEHGLLLSKEVLRNYAFYLDTNVIVHVLFPEARYHADVVSLARACRSLEIELCMCQITVAELRTTVNFNKSLIRKVEGCIPEEMEQQIHNTFYQAFLAARREMPEASVDEILDRFDPSAEKLQADYGFALVDDDWFDSAKSEPSTVRLKEQLKMEAVSRRPDSPKKDRAALHDALLLGWVERQRTLGDTTTSIVTLDGTLPSFVPDRKSDGRALAMTLGALLQWISPLAASEETAATLSGIFSEALRQQLLPQETFLDLQDFVVFAELRQETALLPAEDVEGCIKYLKSRAAMLDVSKPEHREKLAGEISRYFSSPERKYRRHVEMLEQQVEETQHELERLSADKELELQHAASENERLVQQLIRESNESIQALNDRLDKLARQNENLGLKIQEANDAVAQERAKREEELLRESANRRGLIALFFFVLLTEIGVLVADQLGSGRTLLNRVESMPLLVSFLAGIGAVAAPVIIGKRRLEVLAWSIKRLFRE